MTDSIGVIASASTLSVATTTIYTVPTGKALVFKPMFLCQANSSGTTTFKLTINGCDIFLTAAIAASNFFWSSAAQMYKAGAAIPNGAAQADVVAPAFATTGFGGWYASAGQTVTYTVGTAALLACNIQLVGSLIDLS